jgi:hypothetical protein
VITTFNTAGLPTAGGSNLGGLPGRMPTQYTEHFSLEAEYDLGHALVANVGYEAALGRHLMYNYDANALGDIQGAPLNPLVNSVNTFGSNGWSSNNMMIAGLKHQFSHTFSAEGQFTWAHSLDTNSGPYSRDPYLYNPAYSFGGSDFDVRRTYKVFGVWEPVLFHGNHGWAEKVAGGWSLSGIATFHTGFHWTPVFQAPHQFYCNTCNYGYVNLRPHYLGGGGHDTSNDAFKTGGNFANPGVINTGTNNNMFSDAYFSIPDYSAAITDDAGQATTTFLPPPGLDRNSFLGPGYRDVDMTVGKAFGLPNMRVLGENAKLEIKANFLNIFNILNINPSTVNTNIAVPSLGQATGALGARNIDFQARFSF